MIWDERYKEGQQLVHLKKSLFDATVKYRSDEVSNFLEVKKNNFFENQKKLIFFPSIKKAIIKSNGKPI